MNRYATWDELLDATVHADGGSKPLEVIIYPPYGREKYIGMHLRGVGVTDTRNYRIGTIASRRRRSEAYARMMVVDLLAVHYDLDVEHVRQYGPEIVFTWNDAPWESWDEEDW